MSIFLVIPHFAGSNDFVQGLQKISSAFNPNYNFSFKGYVHDKKNLKDDWSKVMSDFNKVLK